MNKFVQGQGLDSPYTTLYVSYNTNAPLHRDARNERSIPVWVIALGDFKGGGLWIEDVGDQGPVVRVLPTGETRAGFVRDIHDRPYKFDGLRWQSAEPWCGKDRWVIAAYVPVGALTCIDEYSEELRDLGFRLDGLEPGSDGIVCRSVISLEGCSFPVSSFETGDVSIADGDDYLLSGESDGEFNNDVLWEIDCPREVLDEDWLGNVVFLHESSARLCRTLTQEISNAHSACTDVGVLIGQLVVAENERDWYEGLLWDDYVAGESCIVKSLSRDVALCPDEPACAAEVFLQTRTVSIAEARKELALWVPSALEEVTSLEQTNQAVLRIVTDDIEELIKEGKRVVQVPGKAVLTRKAGIGKRRFRCVACGNYVPTGSPDSNNLYASGVEGLTVRTALCYAAYRGWAALSADIRTAFLNAPLSGELESEEVIIVRPPHILVEMNILSSNHRWRVLKALYGLRQAPLAWARFRD